MTARRRRAAALSLMLAAALALSGCSVQERPAEATAGSTGGATAGATGGATPDATATPRNSPVPSPAAQGTSSGPPVRSPQATPARSALPRGGTSLFPAHRLVGYSGHPLSPGLGRLGIGDLDERVEEIEAQAAAFAGGRKVLPVLELITVVVQSEPGADGKYRTFTPDETIRQYLEAARRHKALLLLNIQPGRSSMTAEVKRLEKWLKEPDVGLALDPEWDITDAELPGAVYGSTAGEEINAIAADIDALVKREKLPQKALVFHQVAVGVVTNEAAIGDYAGVEVIKSADGIGSANLKIEAYDLLTEGLPSSIHPGFKLFFEEDAALGPLMTPQEVLALDPQPEYILYE